MDLIQANKNRIQLIAKSVAYRIGQYDWSYHGGAWRGFDGYLEGQLIREDAIKWWWPGNPQAVIYQENIRPTSVSKQDFGPERIIEQNVTERYQSKIDIPAGTTYEDTVSHTFTKTTSREESYKQGIKVMLEEQLKAGVDIKSGQELTLNFEQRYGSSESQSDTLSRKLSIVGPKSILYTFSRSLNKIEQEVNAKTDFESTLTFVDETQIQTENIDAGTWLAATFGFRKFPTHNRWSFQVDSIATLLNVMRRVAPSSIPLYTEYMDNHEDAGYINAIEAPPGPASFIMRFDDVIHQDVDVQEK